MAVDWMLVATVSAPVLAAGCGAWISRWLENRPKLVAFYGHVSEFDIKSSDSGQNQFKVHTHSIVVRNVGRKTARNVRIGHAVLPDNFKVFPVISHEIVDLPGGGKEILIPSFVPNRQVTVSYLYYPPLTWHQINTHIESDEGMAKAIEVLPTPQLSKWLQRVIWALILVGIIAISYLVMAMVLWSMAN